ncbi:dirigent protein 23-like [Chenopodium quinoa]|uniref:dirigent protein 23-like n=1 Tax=Chenopodium quinoa TaxID=63459 RepID=UPI000B7935CE|nr:dirigent protein 23-like [Chenopodium quinoa]
MARLMFQVMEFVLFTIFVVSPSTTWASMASQADEWAKTVEEGKERTTTLQFYFHDTLSGKSPSAVKVAQPIQQENQTLTGFGVVMMADDPLTVGPDPKSKLVGRAQGLYGSACQDELGLVMALSYTFNDGKYNGSSISIMGRNSAMEPVREMPVVGGTGFFRMARGYALAHTYWIDVKTGDAIVGYNVTLVH